MQQTCASVATERPEDQRCSEPARRWSSFPQQRRLMDSRRSILIVDQSEDLLLRLEHLLGSAGFTTTVTCDQLNELLTGSTYDLVVICHYPPEMDAATVLRHAAPGPRPACIVLHSQDEYPFQAEYFYSAGAHTRSRRSGASTSPSVSGSYFQASKAPARHSCARGFRGAGDKEVG